MDELHGLHWVWVFGGSGLHERSQRSYDYDDGIMKLWLWLCIMIDRTKQGSAGADGKKTKKRIKY